MKPHIVLRFSSSDEEDEYSSSSKIDINPRSQKKASLKLLKSELIEISTDSDESMNIPQINSEKPLENKSIGINRTFRFPPRSLPPSNQSFSKANKLKISLDDYDYEYTDEENHSDKNKYELPPEENSNSMKANSPALSQSFFNDSESNLNHTTLPSSPNTQIQNIIHQSNEESDLNATNNEPNPEESLTNSINRNILSINNNNNILNQNVFPIYRCRREASKIAGRPINFKFYRSDREIMTAIAKGFKYDKVEIFLNGVIVSKIQKKRTKSKSKSVGFDLYKEPGDQYEAEIIFTHQKDTLPREISIRVYDPLIGLPNKIESIKPKYNKNKKLWQMNFKGKFVLRSIKNTILGDDQMNKLMYVRKTEQDVLDIDILEEIDEIFIFSFSISSFLCKI